MTEKRPPRPAATEPELPEEASGALARLEGRLDDVAQRFDQTDWVELVAAIVLAVATVLAAWSAYQSSRWGGEQAKATNDANGNRLAVTAAIGLVEAQVVVDNQLFVAWTQEAVAGDQEGMAAFEGQIREEAQPAFQAWLDLAEPGELPPGSPTDLPEYDDAVAEAMAVANQASEAAEAALERASEANQRSDNFVLSAVVMASVLFFAGVGSKFRSQRLRVLMVLLSVVILLLGFAFMASMPQNVGI